MSSPPKVRAYGIVLALCASQYACAPRPPSSGPTSSLSESAQPTAHNSVEPEIFSDLSGWWAGPTDECYLNAHHIAFDLDTNTMLVEFKEMSEHFYSDHHGTSYVYDIVNIEDRELDLSLREERRKDADGKLVQWTLRLNDDNTYCWTRSDWSADQCTHFSRSCLRGTAYDWTPDDQDLATKECLDKFNDNPVVQSIRERHKDDFSQDSRNVTCRCATYEMALARPRYADTVPAERTAALGECALRHAPAGELRTLAEMCIARLVAAGIEESAGHQYCDCFAKKIEAVADTTTAQTTAEVVEAAKAAASECAAKHLPSGTQPP